MVQYKFDTNSQYNMFYYH